MSPTSSRHLVSSLRSINPRDARGFTIVELLVVISILAMFFGMIIVGTRPNIDNEVLRAAQQIASTILLTQSRGLGTPTGSAVVIQPELQPAASAAPSTPPTKFIASALYNAEVPAHLEVSVASGLPVSPTSVQATVDLVALTPGPFPLEEQLKTGFRIQFFAQSPAIPVSAWFAFKLAPVSATPTPPQATVPGIVNLSFQDGQTTDNTVWPIPPLSPPGVPTGGLLARIARAPLQGDASLILRRTVAIDLRYSGTGDDPAADWGSLAGAGAIAIVFDPVGSLDVLVRGLDAPPVLVRQPVEPVYLLVAARRDIDNDSALAEARSRWVAIQPHTGRVTVSPNVPQQAKDRAAVRAARQRARATLNTGA